MSTLGRWQKNRPRATCEACLLQPVLADAFQVGLEIKTLVQRGLPGLADPAQGLLAQLISHANRFPCFGHASPLIQPLVCYIFILGRLILPNAFAVAHHAVSVLNNAVLLILLDRLCGPVWSIQRRKST